MTEHSVVGGDHDRHIYGPDKDNQYVDLWTRHGSHGLAILIHGGYWRAEYSASTLTPLAADLVERGWDAAVIEYRRLGAGGGYPILLEDAATAVDWIVRDRPRRVHRIALIGHSVGGELALLNARNADLVLGLAPVTDVTRTYEEGLGEDAAVEFMAGATPEQAPEAYAESSPRWNLPVGRPVLITHGVNDERVPIQHSRDYRDAAVAGGDSVELREFADLSHLEEIDPKAPHWAPAVEWLETHSVD